jgi:hypothetical protein
VFKETALLSFDVFDACRYFVQVMLRFVSNLVFGLPLLNMLHSFSVVLYLLCLVLEQYSSYRSLNL